MRRIGLFVVLTFAVSLATHSPAASNPSQPDIQSALAQMDAFVQQTMAKIHVPGVAVAVVYRDRVVFLKGYGVRRVGDAEQVTPDTVFELASLSKPISSTIVASLVGTGDVTWDDRIVALDPGFALADPAASAQVTIRDLFSHRSGLPTGAGDVLEDLDDSRPHILHQLRLVPLAGASRTTYHYSNFGLTEAAIAAAKKVGRRWEDIADQRLYSKLGMSNTSSRFSDYLNNPNKASLHILVNGVYQNRYVREADAESPAGGVSSSVRDLAQWLRLQLSSGTWNGRRIVAKAPLVETHKAQICSAKPGPVAPGQCPNHFYGLGWNVSTNAQGNSQLSHSGAFLLGAGTAVYLIPAEQIGIVVLGNFSPIGVPEAVCLSFLDYFHYGAAKFDYLAKFGPIFAQMTAETQDSSRDYRAMQSPPNLSPARPFSAYTGRYFNPYYGTLQVDIERNQLVLRLPPRGAYYELTHWSADIFTYYFASENTGIARRGVVFSGDGHQVTVQNLAVVENNGVFTRIK